jgi:hypothetical protein
VTVANATNALAGATDAAAHAIAQGYSQGTISVGDFNIAKSVIAALSGAGTQTDAELRSTDTWTLQKRAILTIWQNAGIAQLRAHLSPTAYALLTVAITAAQQISTTVGGPTL